MRRIVLAAGILLCVFVSQAQLFISELHYDGAGADTLEYVEITGPAETDLSCYKLLFINGTGSAVYMQKSLKGIKLTKENDQGFGTVRFTYNTSDIQNGPSDGLLLYDSCSKTALQYLSYEGQMGPVPNYTTFSSTNIGVSESNTPDSLSLLAKGIVGKTIQLVWEGPAKNSKDAINSNLSFPSIPRGTVSGKVYLDEDKNCQLGNMEKDLPSVAVSLVSLGVDSFANTEDDSVIFSTMTNLRGDYALLYVPSAKYYIKIYPPSAYLAPFLDSVIQINTASTTVAFCLQPVLTTGLTSTYPHPEIDIVPNPVADFISFSHTPSLLYKIEIRDAQGALVKTWETKREEKHWDLSDIQNGYYLCTMLSDHGISTKKFVKSSR